MPFKKFWRVIVAVALQAWSIFEAIKFYADWRGRYDALAESYHEMGGGYAMIGYILNPPPWFYPLAFLTGMALLYWHFNRDRLSLQKSQGTSPLVIIYDLTNPGKKFWSKEQIKDAEGRLSQGTYWEYRAVIKNASSKTVKNVKVKVEAIGLMPTRPEISRFDSSKGQLVDLSPGEEELAVIRCWFNPPIVEGLICGDDIYGPIKMTVTGDDVPPTFRIFKFSPEKMPAVY